MFAPTYFGVANFSPRYFPPGVIGDQIPPTPGGGGGGSSGVVGTKFNQAPPVAKKEPLYLAQALQEDEELLLILKAFTEVITWH
jgi:hypothetical protein